ncbi:type II secretion system F family protein [Limisalsivibrio acetivorans]|uniref:type II secretion system F family protein n=1 Tax=Limisalsivibrio acetivorans TaxID=1304888 RepID=UPI0003B52E77|nr:type II secretion system F family protein [Limisalsivibrio acetivorans]
MPTYSFNGIDKKGKKAKGVREGDTKSAVLAKLMGEGIIVSDIQQVKSRKGRSFSIPFLPGGSKKSLPDIFFQLSLLLGSGIPLVSALRILSGSIGGQKVRNMLLDVAGSVSEGNRFSEALAKFPNFFEDMYVNMIRASEDVGKLSSVLMDIATFEEEKRQVKDKLTSALMYPVAVLVLGMGVVGFLLSYVVPKLENIFASAGTDIPATTKMLVGIAEILREYGVFIFVFLLAAVVALRWLYVNNPKFRMETDKRILRIGFVRQVLIARFAHILSFQLKEGLPLTQALSNSAGVMWNRAFTEKIVRIEDDVKSGEKFSSAVSKAGGFPELFEAAAATGEQSGNMAGLLERVSTFYGKKTEQYTSRFVSVVEPVFIMFIGVIIGFIVVSIMEPLFQLNTLVG